ncbi:MAG: ferrochelatase [Kineosporiaceae bacterium]
MTLPADLPAPSAPLAPYDSVLLLSFGGPEAPEDVVPFLQNVTRGRGIPPERLVEVGAHYFGFGGRSPINDQNRALLQALRDRMGEVGIDVPIAWGNRNWAPFLADALRELHEQGARRVAVILTSAFSSYSGCRQYREDLAGALAALEAEGRHLQVDKIRHYFNHPGLVAVTTDAVTDAARRLDAAGVQDWRLVFVTHSLPLELARTAGPDGDAYTAQHRDLAAVVAAQVSRRLDRPLPWDLVFCSRSGPPQQPWLEPDVNDHLARLAADGAGGVLASPIGFVSDHMEVVYDLDTQARQTADELGLALERAATPGTDPRFVAGLVDLLLELAAQARGEDVDRPAWGELGPTWSRCPVGCCPNPRAERPAACGQDGSTLPV